jgi:acetyl esterase/lipase
VAVSGFLVAPTASPPAGGYPVVSWAHGTTGLADQCAPSRAAFQGSLVNDGIVGTLVLRGLIVVATDYEGLGVTGPHPYLVGRSEGRSVLDAARAAIGLPDLQASNHVALFGYSQGGHAVLWADQIAREYAPDVDVGAVVATAPVGDLVRVANHWRISDEQPYLLSALEGWSRFYHQPLRSLLTSKGREARTQLRRRCTGQLDWQRFGSGLIRGISWPLRPWLDLARANTPGATPLAAPVLVQQGDADTLIPMDTNVALVHGLCAHGTEAELRVYPDADHEVVLDLGLPDAASWIMETLRGAPRGDSCNG